MDPAQARQYTPEPETFEYTSRDAIIYALGIGARAKEDLRYIYENAEGFTPYPTYLVAPGLMAGANLTGWPGIEFDLVRILHGEQYLEIYEPLPSEARLKSQARVIDILDKGKGALILMEVKTFDADTNKPIAMQIISTFQVGSGNFGGARSHPEEKAAAEIPKREPDAVVEEKTDVDQATLYRMGSLDLNPLHVDPQFAKMSGFKEPILHGLCSMGFAARHVIKTWAGNDASLFKAIKVRFSSPVIPGQTLRTEMWKENDLIVFQVKVKETDKVVVSNGWISLKTISDKPTIPDRLQAKL